MFDTESRGLLEVDEILKCLTNVGEKLNEEEANTFKENLNINELGLFDYNGKINDIGLFFLSNIYVIYFQNFFLNLLNHQKPKQKKKERKRRRKNKY